MSESEKPEQRRAYFRLLYPEPERPQMLSKDHKHRVLEIAEGGIRIVVSRDENMQVGDTLSGDIQFHDGVAEPVSGTVLRLEADLAVVKLARGLSFRRVMAEQAYIQKKYPAFMAEHRSRRS